MSCFIKLFITSFDRCDNANWIIFTKSKNKLVKLCTGIFNFEYSWCGIINITKEFFTYKSEIFEELSYRDWNTFKPSKCHKSIQTIIRYYNKKTFGHSNPTKHKGQYDRSSYRKNK